MNGFQFPVSVVLLYAIALASVTVYLPFLAVGFARTQVGYDVAAPRAMFDKLPDYAKRATWAHQNAFEVFPMFTAAALMAYITGIESQWAAIAAIAFVVARIFYSLFYILNVPVLRSLMFGLGSTCTATLFILSLLHVTP